MQIVLTLTPHQFIGRRRLRARVPIEPVVRHGQAAELDVYIGVVCQFLHVGSPLLENCITCAVVEPYAKRSTEVVEHEDGIWHGGYQFEKVSVLLMIVPSVVC